MKTVADVCCEVHIRITDLFEPCTNGLSLFTTFKVDYAAFFYHIGNHISIEKTKFGLSPTAEGSIKGYPSVNGLFLRRPAYLSQKEMGTGVSYSISLLIGRSGSFSKVTSVPAGFG